MKSALITIMTKAVNDTYYHYTSLHL